MLLRKGIFFKKELLEIENMRAEKKNFIAESEGRMEEICQKVEQNQERVK